ncbi:MAG: drug/metabolite transporter (DMT)-like permease [Ascidiaceihabitans sp.]|jgi:drug/metabolite transporter (DMT)-like permease
MRFGPLSNNATGAALALAAFAVFSTHDVIVKKLGVTYSPFQVVFITALLSFPILTLVMMRDSTPDTLQPKHPYWIATRSLVGVVSALCAFYAVITLPLSQFYAFLFAAPLIITVLAIPMLGEVVRLRRGLAVVVGLIGVLIVLRPGSSEFTAGHMAAITAACAGAFVSIITRKISAEERSVVMIIYPMMSNLVITAMILPFVYIQIPLADLGLFAIDTVLVLVAMWLLVSAYTRADAIIVAPMQYSQIIWATLFGIFIFAEYPAWQTYLGTAVIVLSGAYILRREASGGASENTPVLKTRTRAGHAMTLRVGNILRGRRRRDK